MSDRPWITRAQVRGGSLVLSVVAGTVAASAFSFTAKLYRTVPGLDVHGYAEADAWIVLLTSPFASLLNICLCVPLIATANRLDGTAQHRADPAILPPDLFLPLAAFVALVGAYSFLAVPPISSIMAEGTFTANVLAMPKSFRDGAPAYCVGALAGAAAYILAVRWMVRASSS